MRFPRTQYLPVGILFVQSCKLSVKKLLVVRLFPVFHKMTSMIRLLIMPKTIGNASFSWYKISFQIYNIEKKFGNFSLLMVSKLWRSMCMYYSKCHYKYIHIYMSSANNCSVIQKSTCQFWPCKVSQWVFIL